eukprot:4215694-Amphidinium_carterae.2
MPLVSTSRGSWLLGEIEKCCEAVVNLARSTSPKEMRTVAECLMGCSKGAWTACIALRMMGEV